MLFLNSCTNEDPAREAKDDLININQAKEYFNSTPIKIKNNIYFSNEIDWEKGHFENDTLSIPILSNKPILIKRLKNLNSSKYLYPFLLVTKNKSNNTFDYNLKVFISTNSNGYNIDSYHLYDGNNKLILNKEKSGISTTSKTSKNSRVAGCQLWGRFSIDRETGRETLLYTWWECSSSGSSQPEQAPPGDGGGGEVSSDTSVEDFIDDTQLTDCLIDIMTLLKNASNADIKKVFEKLGLNNTNFVTMNMGTVGVGNYAETKKISNYHYSITFTQDSYTSATKLYKATALLHEMIHAYMLSVVDDYNTYPTNAPFTDFPELFKMYVNKTSPTGNAVYAQHEDMANKYVNAIASALEEYQWNETGIPSSLADKQVFLDMAWSGLHNTEVFNNKFPAGSIDNTRITNRITAETNGVYYQGQWAVGKSCN